MTDTRYLKKWKIEETAIADPIQGQVKDPDDLVRFLKGLQDEAVTKFIVILLDQENNSLGNEIVGMDIQPAALHRKTLYRPIILHDAPRFIILTNHPSGDATPSDGDRDLVRDVHLQAKQAIESELVDYIIVGKDSYWSMSVEDGTACHCGQQREL